MLCQFFRGALGTEVVRVRAYSVVAVVRARDDDGEQLALGPGQLGGAEHDLLVKIHRAPEDGRPQAHGLHDVEDLAGPADGRVVLSLEVAGRLPHLDQAQVSHSGMDFACRLKLWTPDVKVPPCGREQRGKDRCLTWGTERRTRRKNVNPAASTHSWATASPTSSTRPRRRRTRSARMPAGRAFASSRKRRQRPPSASTS